MSILLPLYLLVPLLAFFIIILTGSRHERTISMTAFSAVGLQAALMLLGLAYWAWQGFPDVHLREITVFRTPDFDYFIALSFDRIAAVFLLVGSILGFLVTAYSRYYLHREDGYKRFFATKMLFYTGYYITIFAGNFETLFIGWELLGVTSFLLIAFYRTRFLPVKNAVKVFSVYRMGDVGILLAMWMSHHLWHENITFDQLLNYKWVDHQLLGHTLAGMLISGGILLAAAVKSAQLPFSSWLPRAMEGPTPSSAIFYGSLSVNMGVYLLLRTYPFWMHLWYMQVLVILMGLSTSFVASSIARVQSTIKSQVAYASIAQLGLIFVEVALGWHTLALIHFAGNAFLRTYQLLVSPSVVSYLIREQMYGQSVSPKTLAARYTNRWRQSLYVLALKEWNLDNLLYRYLWNPIKWGASRLNFLSTRRLIQFFIPLYAVGILFAAFQSSFPTVIRTASPILMAILALLLVLKAFGERQHVRLSWLLIVTSHAWIALAIYVNDPYSLTEGLLYVSGILISGAAGFAALHRLRKLEGGIDLSQFHGHIYEHPKLGLLFLLACLGVAGFPITPSFVGKDLMFSHIHDYQNALAFVVALSFIVDGLAIIRIYARIFLGPHSKPYHAIAHRSA